MKKRTQRIIVILVAAAMILSVLIPALSVMAGATVTKDDIANIKGELADITAQKNEAQKRLNAIRGDLSKAKEQVELIQGQIVRTEAQILASQRLLDQYDLEIQDKEEDIAQLEEQEEQQYRQFCEHVRWMEETGSVSYLSILFRAASFGEMLDYTTLIGDIMDYSNGIIDRLKATQSQLSGARDDLQLLRDDQSAAQSELESQKSELELQEQEASELVGQISASASEYAAEVQALAADEAKIKKELAEAERKYAEQLANLNVSGAWYWPLPGRYKLSSLFGSRRDPITGRADNHTGTDIPALSGEKIHAAQAGVVTTVGTNKYSSYGYYCIISHGNGKATLYAHMKTLPIVKEGQTVTKGQVIGYVGTTGRSTGNHLHFELRINGNRSDVLKLYSGMAFTSPSGGTIKGG